MRPPRLVTLGRLHLDAGRDRGGLLARQRRKLALLVLLARSGRPWRREALVALFWGEEPEARARHSLSEALSHLRRVLGPDAIPCRAAEVSLAPDAVELDATAFERRVAVGDWEGAVARWGGPFLDAVQVARAPRFMAWVVAERAALRRQFERACHERCSALLRDREDEACVALAERWLEMAPRSAEGALFLLNACRAPGTAAARRHALERYDALVARLRALGEAEGPDVAVAALAARLRAQGAVPLTERPTEPSPDRMRWRPLLGPAAALVRRLRRGARRS